LNLGILGLSWCFPLLKKKAGVKDADEWKVLIIEMISELVYLHIVENLRQEIVNRNFSLTP
jgi:hypothetical protein